MPRKSGRGKTARKEAEASAPPNGDSEQNSNNRLNPEAVERKLAVAEGGSLPPRWQKWGCIAGVGIPAIGLISGLLGGLVSLAIGVGAFKERTEAALEKIPELETLLPATRALTSTSRELGQSQVYVIEATRKLIALQRDGSDLSDEEKEELIRLDQILLFQKCDLEDRTPDLATLQCTNAPVKMGSDTEK